MAGLTASQIRALEDLKERLDIDGRLAKAVGGSRQVNKSDIDKARIQVKENVDPIIAQIISEFVGNK